MAEMFADWIKPLIGPLVTAAFTLIGLFLMERWTSRRAERQEEKAQLETVKIYADPLLLSLVSLIYRLKEIFKGEAKFLSGKAPQNEYYHYMFRSTLYRLCAVLGWLRAANRELSGIEVKDQEAYHKIKEAIADFESALARGRFLAKSRLEFLTHHWKIPDDVLSRENVDFLGGRSNS